MAKKFTVVVTDCVQVGTNSFRDIPVAKTFNFDTTITEVIRWAHSLGYKNLRMGDLLFCDNEDDEEEQE